MAAAASAAWVSATFSSCMATAPLATNMVLGGVIAAVGDVAVQLAMEPAPLSLQRTGNMVAIRSLFMAPFLYKYFPLLARVVPGTSTPRVLLRVFVDQAVGSPLTIVLTFGLSSLLRGQPETFLPRLQDQGLPTWAQAACFWPFVHVYNFSRVPVSRQALFAHVASVYWSAALSYRVNKQPVVEGERGSGETQAELRE